MLTKANIDVLEEATMARFLDGLNKEKDSKVELTPYSNLSSMVHVA